MRSDRYQLEGQCRIPVIGWSVGEKRNWNITEEGLFRVQVFVSGMVMSQGLGFTL